MAEDDGWMSQRDDETADEFIARVIAARPPLTDTEKAQLRAIFRAAPSPTQADAA
jgi:hypothetical protein